VAGVAALRGFVAFGAAIMPKGHRDLGRKASLESLFGLRCGN